jgi:glycosyltransferase involved in cell wall biosynthesis
MASDTAGLIVLAAANNWDDVKVADQHLATHLAERTDVLYVDPPLSHLTPINHPELRGSVHGPRQRPLGPSLVRLSPLVPPRGQWRPIARLSQRLVRMQMGRAVRTLDATPTALISGAPYWPTFGSCDERLRVFWAQDDYAGGADLMGLEPSRVLAAELQTAKASDVMVTSSPVVQTMWESRGYPSTFIPFGCDSRRFLVGELELQPSDSVMAAPVVGFVGHVNARIDLTLLEAVAGTGLSVLIVGPLDPTFEPARVAALRRRENVRFVGRKTFDEVPRYMASIDVGIVPYRPGAFNDGSFPLKTLEYLAAGLPVVSTDLPATRWLGTDLVTIARSPADFAIAVQRASGSDGPRAVAARRTFAAGHDWSVRADVWMETLLASANRRAATRNHRDVPIDMSD